MRMQVATLAAAAGLLFAASANATTITFDDVASSGNPPRTSVVSDGFTFTSTHFHIVDDPTLCLFGGCVSDGTQYATEDAPLAGPVTMTPNAGGTFSLTSFDGAEEFLDDAAASAGGFPNASTIHVVGNLLGGGTITHDFQLDGIKDGAGGVPDFQTFTFGPGWTNLTSAVWSGMLVTGAPGSMSFDNINAAAVPEPATLFLLGTGLVGIGRRALRRNRR